MFARLKKSGRYEYLHKSSKTGRSGAKSARRVIATIVRLDEPRVKGGVEPLVRSLARFSGEVDAAAMA